MLIRISSCACIEAPEPQDVDQPQCLFCCWRIRLSVQLLGSSRYASAVIRPSPLATCTTVLFLVSILARRYMNYKLA